MGNRRAVRACFKNGDRHLEDSEPVPVFETRSNGSEPCRIRSLYLGNFLRYASTECASALPVRGICAAVCPSHSSIFYLTLPLCVRYNFARLTVVRITPRLDTVAT